SGRSQRPPAASSTPRQSFSRASERLVDLAEHPGGGIFGQVGDIPHELCHILSHYPRAEVLLQDFEKAPGEAFAQQAASLESGNDESLHRAEPPPALPVAVD